MSKEVISGGILVILGIGIYVVSLTFPALPEGYPGPSLFPQIIGVGLGLMGILLCVSGFRNTSSASASSTDTPGNLKSGNSLVHMLGGVGIIALFPLVYPFLAPLQYTWGLAFNPMFIVMAIMLFAFARLTQVPMRASLLLSILGPLLVFIIFTKLLGVTI